MDPKLHGLVASAFENLDYDTAVAGLLKMPVSAERDVRLARAYRCLGRQDLTRKYAEPHHETRSDAAFEYGMARLAYHPVEAWEHFERSIALDPNVDAYNGLAFLEELRTRGGERDKLYAIFDKGFGLDPANPRLLQTFGVALLNDGKLNEALETFLRVAAHWTKNDSHKGKEPHFDALCNLACVLAKLGEVDEAIDQLGAALDSPQLPHYRRIRIRGDADLSALHGHPRFVELVGESPALMSARPPAPSAGISYPVTTDKVLAYSRSDVWGEVEAACFVLADTVDERWAARDERYSGMSTGHDFEGSGKLIVACLSKSDWLERHLQATTLPVQGLALLTKLLSWYGYGEWEEPLAEFQLDIARHLLPGVLARWAQEPITQDVIETLIVRDRSEEGAAKTPVLSPAVSKALAECLSNDLPAKSRQAVLMALRDQATPEQASAVTDLLKSENVDDVCAGLLASISASREDVDWMHWFQRPEPLIRQLIAKEFVTELGDARAFAFWDGCETAAQDELVRPFLGALGPSVAPRAIEYCRTGRWLRQTLLWLQAQTLRDEDICLFARLRPGAMPGNAPERTRHDMSVGVLCSHNKQLQCSAEQAGLPDVMRPPSVFTASVAGYLGVRERIQWLRDFLPAANRPTTTAIVRSIGMIGDATDLRLLRALGEADPGILQDAWVARMLLGDTLDLLEAVEFRYPWRMWALERLFEAHWPKERARLSAALNASYARGLGGNGDQLLFDASKKRLQALTGSQ